MPFAKILSSWFWFHGSWFCGSCWFYGSCRPLLSTCFCRNKWQALVPGLEAQVIAILSCVKFRVSLKPAHDMQIVLYLELYHTLTRSYHSPSVRPPRLPHKERRRLVRIFSAFFSFPKVSKLRKVIRRGRREMKFELLLLPVTAPGAGTPRRCNFGAALVPDHLAGSGSQGLL